MPKVLLVDRIIVKGREGSLPENDKTNMATNMADGASVTTVRS